MSEGALETLRSWGSPLVVVRRWAGNTNARPEVELLLRLDGVGEAPGRRPVLAFERNSFWRFEPTATFEVATDSVTASAPDGTTTRVARLMLPDSVAQAVHLGQWSTRDLGLPSILPSACGWIGPSAPPRPRAAKALIFWADFGAHSRVALWWACATQPRADPVAVIAMPRRGDDLDEICFGRTPGELMDAAPGLRLLTRRQVKQFARNWREWCSGRPPRAVELPNWPEASAWVGQVPTPLWEFFPRRDQALRLSEFDRVILEHIGPDWSTPLAMHMRMLRGQQARQGFWGNLTITARIAAWAAWEKGRFVERRRATGKAPMTRWEYRVTTAGLALRDRMTRLQDAPPFKLGGFSFYSPRSWVMSEGSPVRTRLR